MDLTQCIAIVNSRISELGHSYYIREETKKDYAEMDRMTNNNKDCHTLNENYSYGKALLLYEANTGDLASYIYYDAGITSDSENFISISMSCTDERYRRKRLSTYLRMVLFLFALNNKIPYIASDVNKDSKALLSRYGFTGEIDVYLEKFDYSYTAYVSTENEIFIDKVEKFFGYR